MMKLSFHNGSAICNSKISLGYSLKSRHWKHSDYLLIHPSGVCSLYW